VTQNLGNVSIVTEVCSYLLSFLDTSRESEWWVDDDDDDDDVVVVGGGC